MVGSQIANLTPNLSFDHNLCFKCPNGSCEPISDIFVSIAFQWYKELFEAMGFDPCNRFLKIQESTQTPTPNIGVHLGVWMFILTLSHTPGFLSWPVLLQTLALVVNPRLGLRQVDFYGNHNGNSTLPTLKKLHWKHQYSIKGEPCNVRYIQGHSLKKIWLWTFWFQWNWKTCLKLCTK
jgi:hypothetical protein